MTDDQAPGQAKKPSLREELIKESETPLIMKDRLGGLLIAVVMFGLAAGMFIRPVLLGSTEDADVTGRRANKLLWLVELGWSRPVGGLLVLLGLLVVWGSLTKRSASAD